MKRLEKKIQKEKIMMDSLPEISLKILDHIKQHGRVTIGEMAKLTGLNRNTLKEQFFVQSASRSISIRFKTISLTFIKTETSMVYLWKKSIRVLVCVG
jgi:hypothetical protein